MSRLIILLITGLCFGVTSAQNQLTGFPVANSEVIGVVPVGDTVYLWGGFTQIGDSMRNGIGSFNIRTGVVTAFNPNPNTPVTSVDIAGHYMLMYGNFDSIGHHYHSGLALIDIRTGVVANWSDGSVLSDGDVFSHDSNYFYYFNGSVIKRIDYNTQTASSWQTPVIPWNSFQAICATDSFVYAGGSYCFYTGSDTIFNYLCRFKKSDGSLDTTWHPQPKYSPTASIKCIGVNRYNQLFVAGDFDSIAGQFRSGGIAGFDANGVITGFNPDNNGAGILSMCVTDNDVWLGSTSHILGGQYRWRIGEIDINSSTATCWDASAVSQSWMGCWWVYASGDTVYASNLYNSGIYIFGGSPRPHPASNAIQGSTMANSGQTIVYGVPDSLGFTYAWRIEGGTGYSIGDSISITWGNGPVGIIKMVENNNNYSTCSSDTVELIVNIASCPAGPDSITGPANAVVNNAANYSVPVTPGAAYNWIVTGGTGTSSANSISVTWGSGVTGTLQLVETSDSLPFCRADTLTRQITLLPSAVYDINEISACIFPNPTTGKVRLQTTGTCNSYSICDMTGKLLVQSALNSADFDLDLGQFTQGVYIITVQGPGKEAYIKLTKL